MMSIGVRKPSGWTTSVTRATANCTAITAQLVANSTRLTELKRESDNTQAGNIALGVAGALLFWPALFAMDFKGTAGKEAASL